MRRERNFGQGRNRRRGSAVVEHHRLILPPRAGLLERSPLWGLFSLAATPMDPEPPVGRRHGSARGPSLAVGEPACDKRLDPEEFSPCRNAPKPTRPPQPPFAGGHHRVHLHLARQGRQAGDCPRLQHPGQRPHLAQAGAEGARGRRPGGTTAEIGPQGRPAAARRARRHQIARPRRRTGCGAC